MSLALGVKSASWAASQSLQSGGRSIAAEKVGFCTSVRGNPVLRIAPAKSGANHPEKLQRRIQPVLNVASAGGPGRSSSEGILGVTGTAVDRWGVYRYSRSARVKGTLPDVFKYCSDFSHTCEWDPAMQASWKEGPQGIPVGVGTTFSLETQFKIGPVKKYAVTRYTVLEFEPPDMFAISGESDPTFPLARVVYGAESVAHVAIDTLTFYEDGPGKTRVNYSFNTVLKGGVLGLATPLLSPFLWLLGTEAIKGLERRLNKTPALHTGVLAGFRDEVGNWLVSGVSMTSWGLLSSIPAFEEGESLLSLFLKTAGPNLENWPLRPELGDQSWLWLGAWHLGLFSFMGLSKLGLKRRQLGVSD